MTISCSPIKQLWNIMKYIFICCSICSSCLKDFLKIHMITPFCTCYYISVIPHKFGLLFFGIYLPYEIFRFSIKKDYPKIFFRKSLDKKLLNHTSLFNIFTWEKYWWKKIWAQTLDFWTIKENMSFKKTKPELFSSTCLMKS